MFGDHPEVFGVNGFGVGAEVGPQGVLDDGLQGIRIGLMTLGRVDEAEGCPEHPAL